MFRKTLKDVFISINSHKHFYWKDVNIKNKTKEMFTTQDQMVGSDGETIKNFAIDKRLYMQNEAIFWLLINHTKKAEIKKLGIKEVKFTDVMEKVFGSMPNIHNLREFFRNDIIQLLWIHDFY